MVILQGGKSHRVEAWQLQVVSLKITVSHLTCYVANKCLNVCEWSEFV